MTDPFRFADELGPRKIVHITEPSIGLKAIVVIDNTAAGPAIGGTRMAPDVSLEECCRLARAMTLKNAAAGLPHGGAKSVIAADPAMPKALKEDMIRAFAVAIKDLTEYIPGPDMGTDETAMAWVKDEIGRAAGLPRVLGGIPLDEIGATGYGVAVAALAAESYSGVKLDGARIAVQGFGAVGRHAAQFLAKSGTNLVAASDTKGAVYDPNGLDLAQLSELKANGRSVADYVGGKVISPDDLIGIECDIWIPAARPDVLRDDNIDRLRTRVVLQGANIPATAEAERRMHARGILSIPDFVANAGGVITAAVEYQGGTEGAAFERIKDKITENTRAMLDLAKSENVMPREAAVRLARARILRAASTRRWHR